MYVTSKTVMWSYIIKQYIKSIHIHLRSKLRITVCSSSMSKTDNVVKLAIKDPDHTNCVYRKPTYDISINEPEI